MTDNIIGKVIVITGASSGMGEAAARYLAEKGAKVVMAARRIDRIEAIASELQKQNKEAIAVATDVGLMPLSRLEQRNVDEWNQMIDVNLRGVLHGIAAVLPYMKSQKTGHIINTASVAAHLVFQSSAVYSATKFAVRALTDGLRQEMAAHNIRVTLVSPGAVKTELLEHITDKDVKAANQDYVENIGVPAETFARMVAFAINEPEDVGVSEIIFRPTAQEL